MKLSQFRRIIKEEVRRMLKEATKEDIVRKLTTTEKSILKVLGYTITEFKDFLGEVEAGHWDGITLNDFTLAKWVAIELDAMFDDDRRLGARMASKIHKISPQMINDVNKELGYTLWSPTDMPYS